MAPAPKDLATRAIQALARTEKSLVQLRALLSRHALPGDDVEAVLARLVDQGLQSDARCALSLARKGHGKGHTRERAALDLEAAGITAKDAREALDTVFPHGANPEQFRQLVQSLVPPGAPLRQRQRAARKLVSMGHPEEDVRHACGLDHDDA